MSLSPDQISLKDALAFVVDNRGKTAPTAETGYALIATNCISNDDLYPTYKNVRYVSEEIFHNWFRAHPKPGDIILTNKGSQNGAICLVPEVVDFCIAQDMMALRADPERIDSLYLFAALRSAPIQQAIKNLNVDGVIPHFKKTDFDKLFIPLPDRGVQILIGRLHFCLVEKIELNRKMNATMEAMARALFRDWFVDFGPTRAKMEGRAPYLSPDFWSLFPDRLDDAGKPEEWEEKQLTDFFAIIGGGTPKTSNPAFWDGSIPWFSVTDTPALGSVFVTNTEKTITEAGLTGSSARLVPKGTTIISARGTVGNLAVAGREMTFNQSCYGLQGVGAVGNWATYLIAQNMVSQLQAMAHGSVFSTITRQTFEALTLSKPSPKVLEAFESAVSPLFDRILANVNESRTLAQTRDLLLPRLMSGELRVADLAPSNRETAA